MKKEHKKSTVISDQTSKPKSEKNTHYVDNEKLYEALKARKESGTERISEYIGKALLDISTNFSYKHHFRNYPFREDMVMAGCMACIKAIDNFDVEKYSNPHSYFTQICYYAFIGMIGDEKKSLYVKFKASTGAIAAGLVADLERGNSELTDSLMSNLDVPQEYMEGFITEYEEKQNLNKEDGRKSRKKKEQEKKDNLSEFF